MVVRVHVHGQRAAQRCQRHAYPRAAAPRQVESVVPRLARPHGSLVLHAFLEYDDAARGGGGDGVRGGAEPVGMHPDQVGAAGVGAPSGVVGVDGDGILARGVRVPSEVRARGQHAVRGDVQVRVAEARRHGDGEGGGGVRVDGEAEVAPAIRLYLALLRHTVVEPHL
eukprot:scaffold87085_cov33-Phaeocystis_antarctica.AAC.1